VTVIINAYILYKGISGGIEKFAKFAMPTLFLLAIVLMIKVVLIETPNGTAIQGLDFLWYPDFSKLSSPKVWLAAAGQVFFTLSLGFGAIISYASYIKKDEDIVASGLAATSLNEIAEVILGGSIAIPAAVAFFGVANAESIANSGAFNLAFVSLPAIFSSIPGGDFFGFVWFSLLFFAGATSSVAITVPIIAFLEDEFNLSRRVSVISTIIFMFLVAQVPIFFPKALDEMDFWAGTFFVVLFALIEVIIFFWAFGGERAWDEINRGGLFKVPRFFYYIMKYLTPLILSLIILSWSTSILPAVISERNIQIWIGRGVLVFILLILMFMVHLSSRRRE